MRSIKWFIFLVRRNQNNTPLYLQFGGKKLMKLCETCWIGRHGAVLQFTIDLPGIVEVLDKVLERKNKDTVSKFAHKDNYSSISNPLFLRPSFIYPSPSNYYFSHILPNYYFFFYINFLDRPLFCDTCGFSTPSILLHSFV